MSNSKGKMAEAIGKKSKKKNPESKLQKALAF